MESAAENIKAIVLAAGKGTRMKSARPKVLHEIFSVPLLGWVLRALDDIESTVVIGHGSDEVKKYLSNFPSVSYILQEQQLGTGHAVSVCVDKLKDFKGKILILCGDTPLIEAETIAKFIEFHAVEGAALSVMTAIYDEPTNYGRIVRTDDGQISAIVEQKDATNAQLKIKEINAGIYLLNWQEILPAFRSLDNSNAQGEYYLTDIVAWAVAKGLKTCGWVLENENEIFGINSREHLAIAASIMNSKTLARLMEEGVTITDPITTNISPETEIESDVVILPSVYIEGKNKIASGCKIGPMAHLRGGCEIGENCKIGNFVELKNAKIGANTNISHLSYVGDATLGEDVNIGAGTIFANYNSLTKEKNHTFLDSGASVGSNSVLVAPVELGENAFVAAGTVVTKNVEKNSLVITRAEHKEIKNWSKK